MIYAIVKSTNAVTLAGEITLRESLRRKELAAVPISDAGFDARTLQVQTAKDRSLSPEADQFLTVLIRTLRKAAG